MASDDVRALAAKLLALVDDGSPDGSYAVKLLDRELKALARAVLAQETRPTCATCQYFNEHDNECYVSGHVTPDHFCGYHVPAPPDQPREDEEAK